MSGIYFLIKDGAIVYIGQSTNVEKRVTQHYDKDFDSFRIIPCEKAKLLEYEKRLIKLFKPSLNRPCGGKRLGAGRKYGTRYAEPSVVMRIPLSLVPKVKEIISDKKFGCFKTT